MSTQCLRLILGDQLNQSHSWFKTTSDQVIYLIAELPQELSYVRHHEQKICAFFLAMEQFAAALQAKGHRVLHLTLDQTSQYKSLESLLEDLCEQHQITQIEYQQPDEYRLAEQLGAMAMTRPPADTEHFLLQFEELPEFFKPGASVGRMESFYRKMRRRFDYLMDGDQPAAGQWNFDGDNRKKFKPSDLSSIPKPLLFSNDVSLIRDRLEQHHVEHFGHCDSSIDWPVSRKQALQLLTFFCKHCLANFGRFQDAMTGSADAGYSLYHSRLAFALNIKLISPREVIDRAINTYQKSGQKDDSIDIAQIEGFVRQILGWREFVRGVYWAQMPEYKDLNALGADRDLPAYFWHGKTKMACLGHALDQSLENAYAHHIQRLMVIGNFCLLAGIDPDQVDAWYLGVYADAIQWVQLPNTRGMSQFADGGIVASKPYSAGGNYINKMSDYCRGCHYKQKERTGEQACPFNALYWNFMIAHRETIGANPRTAMTYRSWDKMSEQDQSALLDTARANLARLEDL